MEMEIAKHGNEAYMEIAMQIAIAIVMEKKVDMSEVHGAHADAKSLV
jgi:hypothetical protein